MRQRRHTSQQAAFTSIVPAAHRDISNHVVDRYFSHATE